MEKGVLEGRFGGIKLIAGNISKRHNLRKMPFLGASEDGFSPLGIELAREKAWSREWRRIHQIVNAIRDANQGPLVAFYDCPIAPRRLALIQSNRGQFYEANHAPQGAPRRAWRDFYYRAGWILFKEMNDRWKPREIQMSHLTGHLWVPGMLEATLNAVKNLLRSRNLSLERIFLDTCCYEPGLLDAALATLSDAHRDHRSFKYSELEPELIGLTNDPAITIFTGGL
jgi:hypothetical protein